MRGRPSAGRIYLAEDACTGREGRSLSIDLVPASQVIGVCPRFQLLAGAS